MNVAVIGTSVYPSPPPPASASPSSGDSNLPLALGLGLGLGIGLLVVIIGIVLFFVLRKRPSDAKVADKISVQPASGVEKKKGERDLEDPSMFPSIETTAKSFA